MARPGFVQISSQVQGQLSGPETIMKRDSLSHVLAFEHNVHMPLSGGLSANTDMGFNASVQSPAVFGGQPVHQPISFVKPIDDTTPQLYQALCERELLDKVTFFWTQFSKKGEVELVFEVELLNARLISVQPSMPDLSQPEHDALPYREQVALIYETISWRYGPTAEVEYKTQSDAGKKV